MEIFIHLVTVKSSMKHLDMCLLSRENKAAAKIILFKVTKWIHQRRNNFTKTACHKHIITPYVIFLEQKNIKTSMLLNPPYQTGVCLGLEMHLLVSAILSTLCTINMLVL